MRRVLYLSLYGTIGGAERALLELLSGLDRSRYEPLVVLPSNGPLAEEARRRGAEIVLEPFPTPPLHRLLLPWILFRELRASARLLALVRARGVRLAHCGDVLGLLLLIPAALAGARIVYQVNHLGGVLRRLALNPLALLAVDALVTCSFAQRAELLGATALLEKRTTVVHPGIDPSAFASGGGGGFRAELGVPQAAPLVGLLARYDTWKGHMVFLDAAARIHGARPDVRFAMVGGALNSESLPHVARYQSRVLDRARSLGLGETLHVVGHRQDVARVLSALDVLVCPSEQEPFGMVVLEAMAAGTPVVASDSGGPSEILEHGRSGILFRSGDATSLADHVLALVDDPPRRRSLADAAGVRVREAFQRERYARAIEALYDRLA